MSISEVKSRMGLTALSVCKPSFRFGSSASARPDESDAVIIQYPPVKGQAKQFNLPGMNRLAWNIQSDAPVQWFLSPEKQRELEEMAKENGYEDVKSFVLKAVQEYYDPAEFLSEVLQRHPRLVGVLPRLKAEILGQAGKGKITVNATSLHNYFCKDDPYQYADEVSAIHILYRGLIDQLGFEDIGYRYKRLETYNSKTGNRETLLEFPIVPLSPEEKKKHTQRQKLQEILQTTLFPEGINGPALAQMYETCYRQSALYSLSRHPEGQKILQSMVQPKGNGHYLLTYRGCPGVEIHVGPEHYTRQIDDEKMEYSAFVWGSMGTRILDAGYQQLEKHLKDFDNFGTGISDGGYSALALHRYTGWNPFWLSSDAEELFVTPKSKADFPEGIRKNTKFLEPSMLEYQGKTPETAYGPLLKRLKQMSDNFDQYILTTSTRSFFNERHESYPALKDRLHPSHAYSLIDIDCSGNEPILTMVDPRDTTQPPLKLPFSTYIQHFECISGVKKPST